MADLTPEPPRPTPIDLSWVTTEPGEPGMVTMTPERARRRAKGWMLLTVACVAAAGIATAIGAWPLRLPFAVVGAVAMAWAFRNDGWADGWKAAKGTEAARSAAFSEVDTPTDK